LRVDFRLPLIAVLICIGGSLDAPASENGGCSYENIRDAFMDVCYDRHRLSGDAVDYILDYLGLSWKTRGADSGDLDIRGYVSPGRRLCVLVQAGYDSCGQFGPARYCLVDGGGRVRWERQASIIAPPRISSRGTVALIYEEGRPASERRPDSLRIDFIDIAGTVRGTAKWGGRVRRSEEACSLPELFRFGYGELLIMTLNLDASDTRVRDLRAFNHTFLICVGTNGRERWRRDLGWFKPRNIEFGDWQRILLIYGYESRPGCVEDHSYVIRHMFVDWESEISEPPPSTPPESWLSE
jgi:hypothetical protein